MFNPIKTGKIRNQKIKINVDLEYVRKIIFAIGIFILVDSIFLFISIGSIKDSVIDNLASSGYSRKSAKLISQFSLFGTYIMDWVILIALLISVMIGRSRMEFGNLFNYGWMIGILALTLFPFAMPSANVIMYTKSSILLIPAIYIVYILFQQTNDLKWVRKAKKAKEIRGKYV